VNEAFYEVASIIMLLACQRAYSTVTGKIRLSREFSYLTLESDGGMAGATITITIAIRGQRRMALP
jgi:hypothetical protein